uniref:transposase n=1 Tax=Nonomuraea pusilla TaxID=46177 RepID=UPI00350E3C98
MHARVEPQRDGRVPKVVRPACQGRRGLVGRAWHDRYALRCGIEATIHQAVTITGLRRARYRGIKKIHLEHIVFAIAVNLIRLHVWWNGHPLQRKRASHLA